MSISCVIFCKTFILEKRGKLCAIEIVTLNCIAPERNKFIFSTASFFLRKVYVDYFEKPKITCK